MNNLFNQQNVSDIQRHKANRAYNAKQVLYLCNMSEQQYRDFMLATLADWLSIYHPVHDEEYWMQSHMLLQWWAACWQGFDELVLEQLYGSNGNNRLAIYRKAHQYVFDLECSHAVYLHEDFRNMKGFFEKDIPQPTLSIANEKA